MRTSISTALKEAMKSKDEVGVSTLRLILAAMKDRDIAARGKGQTDGIGEAEILEMLQKMVRQRRESIDMYEKGGRQDLADREAQEIEVIERFLPQPLSAAEVEAAIDQTIEEVQANSIKDMGRVMATLKARYVGRLDAGMTSGRVKQRLMGN